MQRSKRRSINCDRIVEEEQEEEKEKEKRK